MKRQRKPVETQPVIFYRPAWTTGIHTRAQPNTAAHRLLFSAIRVETAKSTTSGHQNAVGSGDNRTERSVKMIKLGDENAKVFCW